MANLVLFVSLTLAVAALVAIIYLLRRR